MGFDAGYAGMVSVTSDAARTATAVYYAAGGIPHTLELRREPVTTAGFTGTLDGDLFLGPPQPVFSASEPERIALDVRAWGPLTLSGGGVALLQRTVLMQARVTAHPALDIIDGRLNAAVGPDLTVESARIDSIAGGPIPPDLDGLINGPGTGPALTSVLRAALGGAGRMLPPVSIPYLSDPKYSSLVSLARLAYRVVDGAFVAGVDADGPLLVTHGDPAQLTDFHLDHPLAGWATSAIINPLLAQGRDDFAAAVGEQHATLDTFSIATADGHIDVHATVSKFGGGATISFHLVPVLTPSGVAPVWVGPVYGGAYTWVQYPASIYLAPTDINVDVHTDAWVDFLDIFGGIITLGAASVVINDMTQSSRSSVTQTVAASAAVGLGDSRVFTLTLPDTTGPAVTFSVERLDFHTHGAVAETTLTAALGTGQIFGAGNTVLLRAAATDGLSWRVKLPQLCDAADPQLRVRWQLRRVDTNQLVFQRDGTAGNNLTATATIDVNALPTRTKFSMSCRVYRVLGAQTEDLFNGKDDVELVDPIDHTHPFVHWSHSVNVPQVAVYPDRTRELLGQQTLVRTSDIHRTDFAGRCRMVERGAFLFDAQASVEYLDALPFPFDQIAGNRARICDYCFFGGPTRTQTLPL